MARLNGITEAQLRQFAPGARRDYIEGLTKGWPELQAAGIDTPLRLSHFLAQTYHETGGYKIVRENTTWTVDQMCKLWPQRFKKTDPIFMARVAACRGDDRDQGLAEIVYGYRTRPDLGNKEDGDGWAYRGGGYFQTTGRDNFRMVGQAIGVDLEGQPDLIENPTVSLKAAVWEWNKHNLNKFADRNYLRVIGNAINRGNPFSKYAPIGERERDNAFVRAWGIFGDGQLPNPLDHGLGASGPDVENLQHQLRDLGYTMTGAADGVFGPSMADAVIAFKLRWKRQTGQDLAAIEPDEMIGPKTRAAIASADPISRPERESATVADVIAAGSTEAAAGQSMQRAGVGKVLLGGALGLSQMVDTTTPAAPAPVADTMSSLTWVPAFHTFLIPVLTAIKFFATNWLWVLFIVAGVWMWSSGFGVIRARLAAFRSGWNLSK